MKASYLLATALVAQLAAAQHIALQDDDKRLDIYQLTVTPAEAPEPRLKHRLLIPDDELEPGNGATFWYRAMLDLDRDTQRVEEKLGRAIKEAEPEAAKGFDTLDELGREFLSMYGSDTPLPTDERHDDRVREAVASLLKWREGEAQVAARRVYCDWGFNERSISGQRTLELMLPEIQRARDLSWLFIYDSRLAIADGRFDDAVRSLQTHIALGRAAAQPPLLVCRLVGKAILGIGVHAIRDFQAAPDSPSLYWALAELPQPFIPLNEAIRYEAGIGPRLYALIDDPTNAERTEAEWNRLLEECLDSLNTQATQEAEAESRGLQRPYSLNGTRLLAWIDSLRKADRNHAGVQLASERLCKRGYTEDEIAGMPVARVLAIDAAAAYQRATQAVEAAFQVPWPEGRAARREALIILDDEADPLGDSPHREVLPIATLTAPSTQAAMSALVRLDRDIAALRLVAALRLHAGQTGSLPESLDEIRIVPVPLNPATAKPFDYRLKGKTAHINLPQSDDLPPYASRYEVTLAE